MAFVREILPGGLTTPDDILALANAISDRVAYEPGTTDVTTAASQVLTMGHGVCQDHAHLFLACVRGLGVPARYVSGYVHTTTEHSASHAWADVWLADIGWTSVDITNRQFASDSHCRLAVARDYDSASPVRGVRSGGGEESMEITARLDAGLVFLSDSRTNAGVDQISVFRKMTVFERPGERVMVLMTSGNLAVSQAVLHVLTRQHDEGGDTIWNAADLFEATRCVGAAVREVYQREAPAVHEQGVGFNVSMIFGGQIGTERCRLFQVYSAGNFIEAGQECPYFQIGEAKYGKPILDRVLRPDTSLDEAANTSA
ncbi:hypothetical protein G6F35_011077 [Rhizopus arrhizus]|nr:hypothetical protein G6F35_011077 [Rhizopus arrhizus]